MARPVDVSQLLTSLKGDKNGNRVAKNPLRKAKFLSKNEREALLRDNRNTSNNITVTEDVKLLVHNKKMVQDVAEQSEIIESVNKDEPSSISHNSNKKLKFNFDWQKSDDTLTDFKPLTSLKVNDLLRL